MNKKIKALAEQGYEGEAGSAQKALENMPHKHGLTIEDLCTDTPEWRWIKIGSNKELFSQCYSQVLNTSTIRYSKYRSNINVELTAAQYADLISLFEFHSDQLKKEFKKEFKKERKRLLENFTDSYIQRHEIWGDSDSSDENTEKPIDCEEKIATKFIDIISNLEFSIDGKIIKTAGFARIDYDRGAYFELEGGLMSSCDFHLKIGFKSRIVPILLDLLFEYTNEKEPALFKNFIYFANDDDDLLSLTLMHKPTMISVLKKVLEMYTKESSEFEELFDVIMILSKLKDVGNEFIQMNFYMSIFKPLDDQIKGIAGRYFSIENKRIKMSELKIVFTSDAVRT